MRIEKEVVSRKQRSEPAQSVLIQLESIFPLQVLSSVSILSDGRLLQAVAKYHAEQHEMARQREQAKRTSGKPTKFFYAKPGDISDANQVQRPAAARWAVTRPCFSLNFRRRFRFRKSLQSEFGLFLRQSTSMGMVLLTLRR